MNEPDADKRAAANFAADRALWRRSLATDAQEDEAERFLDLAAFAEDRLHPDERERVGALLTAGTAADVEAARRPATAAAPDSVLRRAMRLGEPEGGNVVRFAPRIRPSWALRPIREMAQWGSLAAAIVLAGWFGFAMGSDASLSLSQSAQASEPGFLIDVLEPSSGFLHQLGEDVQT
jgi:hypothetical protein